jgi:hypothetical protein
MRTPSFCIRSTQKRPDKSIFFKDLTPYNISEPHNKLVNSTSEISYIRITDDRK